MKDPDPYVKMHEIEPDCAVYPDKKAVVDEAHRRFVNWEVFYFSSEVARKKFDREPLQYVGWLTDPVNGVRFEPTKRSPRLTHGGRPYFFTSDTTRKIFEQVPERYAFRRGK